MSIPRRRPRLPICGLEASRPRPRQEDDNAGLKASVYADAHRRMWIIAQHLRCAGQCCLLSDHASSIVIGCVPVHSRMHRDSLVNNSRHLNDTHVCPDTIPRPLYRPVIDPSAFPGAPYSPNRPIRFRCRITQSPDNDTWLTLSYLL